MEKIIECVPNFSEGRDIEKIDKIVECFRAKEGVKLLNYSSDRDHNRMVITTIGTPENLKRAVIAAIGVAVETIDLTKHKGQHPRIGAADVLPFIPIKNVTMQEAVALSREVGEEVAARFALPVFLYEKSATAPHRENLADVRHGEFEGLTEKMLLPKWQPDFGKPAPHPTAGAAIIGARDFLIAYNVNLNTDNLAIAKAIAKKIRFSSGGFPFCKAMGVELKVKNCVQVSMNLTNFSQTPVYQVFETIKTEAARYGISVSGSELIGLMPLAALTDVTAHYLGLENFSERQILENHLIL